MNNRSFVRDLKNGLDYRQSTYRKVCAFMDTFNTPSDVAAE